MTSTLPSRWQEILRSQAAENVSKVLAQAKLQPDHRRLPRWTVPALLVGVASVSVVSITGKTEGTGKGSVPFDRSTVLSTRTAGLGASAEDLVPSPAPTTAPTPIADTSPTLEAIDRLEQAVPRAPSRHARRRETPKLDQMYADAPPATPAPIPEPPAPTPPPEEKPQPVVINVGTRLAAVLTDPVVTGAALAPATARLANDFQIGDRLVIPAGTMLVGEGFATQHDDRAQVIFTAIVRDGKTIRFEGWALQDGEAGVRGKVIRKGSKTRKGAGAVLGAAASALTHGVAGALSGLEGAALASLGSSASSELTAVSREWRQSDKVLRVPAGVPITVYVRRDVTME